ncbi:Trimethylamine methyltransferase (MTTB) [Roseovarius litorisediminis]|uniref:Methyltransferase n=1 Tax=Roseovarius litorisediminis TaxID=1312363 RepID=A0A1Y5SX25_9RHOB|nr:trimethylamine methyltransferase family protein [Roseovarius litorisediminis]SLN50099.1 Trimethylamine methyltransferase (MTTB) [Roseovarius litorisediminis]
MPSSPPNQGKNVTRRGRRARAAPGGNGRPLASTCVKGGHYSPVSQENLGRIHQAALRILSQTGMADSPPAVVETVSKAGGTTDADGRLLFPEKLITRMLETLPRDLTLCGQTARHDMDLRGTRVHVGSGGAAPMLVDLDSDSYRPSTLRDLYDVARMVDALDNVHFFSRSLVARDMNTTALLDINTAFASLAGTQKHVMVAAQSTENLREIAAMCHIIAGSAEAFRARPFLSLNINHVVPPLRFSAEACDVLREAVLQGIPVHINTFGQLGASSPVTIAGCVAQTVAETLAGLCFAWLLDPQVKAVFGMRPMITDLRTGGMAGGAGEQALLTAVSVQMARYYNLPNSTIAGATDSKISDAQSGYEKALTISSAAQCGANLITQACGMQAGLMGASPESYVVDNEMLGAVLRSLSPVGVDDTTLATDVIDRVARGEGHFLGQADTLARMQTDFLYPVIADRTPPEEWQAAGKPDIRVRAKARAQEILTSHYPTHLSADTQAKLRARFDIRLPPQAMNRPHMQGAE